MTLTVSEPPLYRLCNTGAVAESPVIRCGSEKRTQAECLDRAGRLAAALHRLGVQQGDRVALLARNSIDFLEVSLAIASAGGNPVPINYHWAAPEIAHVIKDSGIRVMFCDSPLRGKAESAIAVADASVRLIGIEPRNDDHETHDQLIAEEAEPLPYQEGALPASMGLIYTSGTTGKPKGVLRERMTGHQLLSVAGSTATRMGLRDGGSMLVAGPLYHTSPNAVALLALRMGANITIMEYFDPEAFLALVDEYSIEHAKVVPTMLSRLLSLPDEVKSKYDVSSLTHLIHSAAPCPPAIKSRALDWFGDAVQEFYGCTEGGTITWITAQEWRAKPGSVGRPIDGSNVSIVRDDGSAAEPGEVGHVQVTAPEYWPHFQYLNRAGETVFPIDVGDLGYLDLDGYLFLTGRSAEVVNVGGANVYPAEIEAAALEVASVEDAAAVGYSSDSDLGEEIALFVVLRPGATSGSEDLIRELASRLAAYKLPRTIEIRSSLPRDDNGKVYKKHLAPAEPAPS